MTDKRRGPVEGLIKAILFIASLVYYSAIRVWNFCYDANIFKIHSSGVRIISVGNITLGGTGKTPFVIFLAKLLNTRGASTGILIRGYGNDEWRMLRDKLRHIPVIKDRDRVRSAKEAKKLYNPSVLILDDGFQHRRLRRGLDILLVDAAEGFGNGQILPRGILREPLGSIRRADFVVLTKSDFGRANLDSIKLTLAGLKIKGTVLEAQYRPLDFLRLGASSPLGLDVVRGKRISALSAVANPEYFKYMLKNLGAELADIADYPDHHDYTLADLDSVRERAKNLSCEYIVITEKDTVKLNDIKAGERGLPILALRIELVITDGLEKLDAGLNSVHIF